MDTELRRLGGQAATTSEALEKVHRRAHLQGEKRDQYSRREIIRVTGVPQKHGENTTSLVCRIAYNLGVNISADDVSVSHRSGRQNGSAPRPILCKFVRRETKYQILRNRKLAASIKTDDDGRPVRIFVDEELTTMRANVTKMLRQEKIDHYTRDGKVFIMQRDGKFKLCDTPVDWEELEWTDKVKTDLGIYPRL